jgi:hypothetical protein
MVDSTTAKKSIAGEEQSAPGEKTYKVWLEIEEYDERTDTYIECDAPGGELATFDTYDDAYDFAAQIDSAYSNYAARTNAIKPFTVVGYWTDNEQGFIETTMATSIDNACHRARQQLATRETSECFPADAVEEVNERIQIVAVFYGHPDCALVQS